MLVIAKGYDLDASSLRHFPNAQSLQHFLDPIGTIDRNLNVGELQRPMDALCCHPSSEAQCRDQRYRRVLWVVLGINVAMFVAEVIAGFATGSVSLQADALDFLSDATSYGFSLFVVGRALEYRARAALAKGLTMGCLGFWVLASAVWNASRGALPEAITMGLVGFGALLANAIVFALLWAYRSGDSNMQSVWLCSRNDVIGNAAVLLAAAGVFGTGTGWPDVLVASIMGALALQGAWLVVRQAWGEIAGVLP
jgi:Co/Zn/Cd efflux system component